jgi:hypothetical protein
VRQEQTHGEYTIAVLPITADSTGIVISGTVRGTRLEVFPDAYIVPPSGDTSWNPPRLTDTAGHNFLWDGGPGGTRPHQYVWNPLHPNRTVFGSLTKYDYHAFTLRFALPAEVALPPLLRLHLTVSVAAFSEFGTNIYPLADPFVFDFTMPTAGSENHST